MPEFSKPYVAIIWKKGENTPQRGVTVFANSLSEARTKLEAEHGQGNVFDLHNEEDAAKVRHTGNDRD